MSLQLVSSGDDCAIAIRDHLLPFIRERGAIEIQRGPVRVTMLRLDPWAFAHWTPFNELSAGEASLPGYGTPCASTHARTCPMAWMLP